MKMTQTELASELLFIREICRRVPPKEASKLINQRRKYLKELRGVVKLLSEIKDREDDLSRN